MDTVSVLHLPDRYQRCRLHNRTPVLAVTGRGTYVACRLPGCRRDAYGQRDVADEPEPTNERPVTDRYGHTFMTYGAGTRCERCALVPVHQGDETDRCTERT